MRIKERSDSILTNLIADHIIEGFCRTGFAIKLIFDVGHYYITDNQLLSINMPYSDYFNHIRNALIQENAKGKS